MLLPHDWRDRHGAVRAWAAITDRAGSRRELWSGTLHASDRGRPRGLAVDCRLPDGTSSLQLGIDPLHAGPTFPLQRAIWLEPAITDPQAPPIAATVPSPPPPAQSPLPPDTPLISVLMPVHDPPLQMLEEAIGSVRAQTFTGWELCLVDDGSSKPEIIAALERHAASDPRIQLKRRQTAGGISTATNTASSSPLANTSPCWTTTTPSPPTRSDTSPTRSPPNPTST